MKKIMHALLLTTLLSGVALSSHTTSAASSSANASVTVPEACTMTGSGMNSHTATITPGTYSGASGSDYENGIGKTTFTVICNDYNGFAIYAIGYTGNEYSGENHTKLVGANSGVAISTKVYASGDTTSNWSMKVNKVTDSTQSYLPANMSIQNSFDSWHVIPDTYTKVAQYKASTGSSITDTTLGAKIDTTYAAFIAPNQPGDTYVGQVKYTMVHPYNETPLQPQQATAGCINYFPNGSNVIGTMGCQSATDGQTKDLLASNYSRTGYGFAGWSDAFDYATNNAAHFYGPQETITVPTGTTANGLSLYAVWVKSAGSLQDSTKVSQLCGTGTGSLTTAPTDGTANLSSVSALTDQRDNETYAIAKLADDKCWMIENLRLESTNRDNSTGALAQGYGTSATYGNFSGLADAESANFTTSTSANSLYYSGVQSGTASIDIGTSDSPALRMPRYNNLNTQSRASNPTSNTFPSDNTTGGMYSYGNYYTWTAAVADTVNRNTNNSSSTTSLCPAGWRLPRGGDKTRIESNNDNDFWNLIVNALNDGVIPANYNDSTNPDYYGSAEAGPVAAKLRSYPNNFLYSGGFGVSSAYDRGGGGKYWSSTAMNRGTSYWFGLDNSYSYVYPGTLFFPKYVGFTIRCTVSVGT